MIALNFVNLDKLFVSKEDGGYLIIPNQARELDNIMTSVSTIASKIASMPLDQISYNLNNPLKHTDNTVNSSDTTKVLEAMRVSMQNLSDMSRKLNKGASPSLE